MSRSPARRSPRSPRPARWRPQSAKRVIDATRAYRHAGRHRSARALHHVWIKPDGTPLVTAGPEQVGRAALYGGTTTLIDFAYWRDGATAQQAIEARDKDFVGKEPVRLGLSHHAALRAAARILRPARRGDPGRLSDAQDLHHQHPARRAAAAWSISATSGRCSRCWRRKAGSASSTPRTTTSSCTCTRS